MSSGIWTQLAAYESAHFQMLESLAVGRMNLFSKAHRSVRNFAIEEKRTTLATQTLSGTAAQSISFNLDGILLGDFVNACTLEVQLPALTATTGLATWVWAVGYAMIESAKILIGGNEVEHLSGDYMELYDELHRKPGQHLRDAVFKMDRVTVPELAAMSAVAQTLYVPIPFFFTRGPHCVLPVGRNFDRIVSQNVRVEVEINFRRIQDIAIVLPVDGADALGSINQSYTHINAQLFVQQVYLENAESEAMWLGGGSAGTYRAMCTTVQGLNKPDQGYQQFDEAGVVDRKRLPLKYPTKNLIMAVADKERLPDRTLNQNDGGLNLAVDALLQSIGTNTTTADNGTYTITQSTSGHMTTGAGSTGTGAVLVVTVAGGAGTVTSITVTSAGTGFVAGDELTIPKANITSSTTDLVITLDAADLQSNKDPYASNTGVSTLFGERCSHQVSATAFATDWNARRQGAKVLSLTDSSGSDGLATAAVAPFYGLESSKDVKEWRGDAQCGALFLPGNRFDYRCANAGVEVEPIKELSFKLSAQERIKVNDNEHHASYLRTVQTLAFNNRPRKGIYTYSFAMDSSSPYPTGTINLGRITNKDLRVVINGTSTKERELLLFAEHINIFEIDSNRTPGQMMYQT